MIVAITGGTGFVGRAIVQQLLQAGHHVRLLVRSRPRSASTHSSVTYHPVDFYQLESLASAVQNCEAVIHLIGIIVETRGVSYASAHVETTRRVLAAAQRAGVKRFVHMSALGSRPHARSRYHQTKWQAEELVRASGLAWTIFRPSIIYGPEDQFVNQFAGFMRFRVVPNIGGGVNLMQPIAVSQVARAFFQSLHEPACASQIYDLCGPERLTLRAILEKIACALNKSVILCPIPIPLAWLLGACLEKILPHPPLCRDQVLMLQEDNIGNPEPTTQLFHLHHEPFTQGIRHYLHP